MQGIGRVGADVLALVGAEFCGSLDVGRLQPTSSGRSEVVLMGSHQHHAGWRDAT